MRPGDNGFMHVTAKELFEFCDLVSDELGYRDGMRVHMREKMLRVWYELTRAYYTESSGESSGESRKEER